MNDEERMALANRKEEVSGFCSGSVWSGEHRYTPGMETQNQYERLTEDEQYMFVLGGGAVMARITIDSRAESVWQAEMLPEADRISF